MHEAENSSIILFLHIVILHAQNTNLTYLIRSKNNGVGYPATFIFQCWISCNLLERKYFWYSVATTSVYLPVIIFVSCMSLFFILYGT